jgi:hypothetical protein
MTFKRTLQSALALSIVATSLGQAQTVRDAYAADVARFCSDTRDVQGRIQCMNAHQTELSEGCRKARQANRREAQDVDGGAQNSTPASNSAAVPPPSGPTTRATSDGGFDSSGRRITGRDFPSIFAPWNVAENLNKAPDLPPIALSETNWTTIARHDLYWQEWTKLGLKLQGDPQYIMLAPFEFTPESIQTALHNRAALLAMNPHLVLLVNVHYKFTPPKNFLPQNSPWWKHGTLEGQFENGNKEYGSHLLDYANPAFQDKVASFCAALIRTGVYDGCMLDGWKDFQDPSASVALIQKLRAAIGEKALLVGNVNGKLPANTANYLNGMYMEGYGARFFPDWRTAAANLLWGESHLRKPAITALEGWYDCDTPQCSGDPAQIQQRGRANLASMRAVTTLSLVFSNGYAVFSDPNPLPTPDHLHDWYSFWDKSLGRPTGPLAVLDHPDLAGAYTRQYEKGEAVFNPPSNHAVVVKFQRPRRSAATGVTASTFTVAAGDGDLFLNSE